MLSEGCCRLSQAILTLENKQINKTYNIKGQEIFKIYSKKLAIIWPAESLLTGKTFLYRYINFFFYMQKSSTIFKSHTASDF